MVKRSTDLDTEREGSLLSRPLPARRGGFPWSEWTVVALAVALFLSLALYHYRLPGLYYDEAADVVPAMQLLKGQPVTLQRDVGLHLLGATSRS